MVAATPGRHTAAHGSQLRGRLRRPESSNAGTWIGPALGAFVGRCPGMVGGRDSGRATMRRSVLACLRYRQPPADRDGGADRCDHWDDHDTRSAEHGTVWRPGAIYG